MHKTTIYLNRLYSVLKKEAPLKKISPIKSFTAYADLYDKTHINSIIFSVNFWKEQDSQESREIHHIILIKDGALPSSYTTQQLQIDQKKEVLGWQGQVNEQMPIAILLLQIGS